MSGERKIDAMGYDVGGLGAKAKPEPARKDVPGTPKDVQVYGDKDNAKA